MLTSSRYKKLASCREDWESQILFTIEKGNRDFWVYKNNPGLLGELELRCREHLLSPSIYQFVKYIGMDPLFHCYHIYNFILVCIDSNKIALLILSRVNPPLSKPKKNHKRASHCQMNAPLEGSSVGILCFLVFCSWTIWIALLWCWLNKCPST